MLGDHHIDLLLIQAKPVFDGVAAGDDGVFLALAAIDVAARLFAETMRLVNQRLQDRQRIGHLILVLAGRR